jgi:UDP-N-acetylglucosamine--N-acetylmuramyl-(pentapeptide) pyrophosphoryl-undecaprenol N-acetylglucosamine transferase
MPNIAVIEEIQRRLAPDKFKLLYIGTRKGMEKRMIERMGVRYKGIFCGKLRRYFSFRNLVDFFKLPVGVLQSFVSILAFRPDVIFCKGGFVCFPVAVAGWMARKKVILHESDFSPGLANKLSARFASKIFVSYEETARFFPKAKVEFTGNPVRKWLNEGDKTGAANLTGLTEKLPVLLFMGGSQGADFINQIVWKNLDDLLRKYQIIHICGANNASGRRIKRIYETEFAGDELKDLYALADLIVTRGGANSLAEIEYIRKPAVVFPLGRQASRGDQIENSKAYIQDHPAVLINEEEYAPANFFSAIDCLINPGDGAGSAHGGTAGSKKVWHNQAISATVMVTDLLLQAHENRS